MQTNRLTSAAATTLWAVLSTLVSGPATAETFEETFDSDPISAGRLVLFGGDGGRFSYDAVGKTLTASYDTVLPTARLVHPLGQSYDDQDDFEVEFDFEILSAGFFADPYQSAQIAFGLMNTSTTGTDRAGGDGGDAFDICTVDYYPNVTFFGGPSLGPTIINADNGANYFDHIQFEFGHETEIGYEGALPLDTLLTARLVYDGRRRVATLTVAGPSGLLLINTKGGRGLQKPVTGGFDVDATTIQLEDQGPTFAINAVGIFLWNDSYAVTSSVVADIRFHRILFQGALRDQAAIADIEADGDVDGYDFLTFANCFNGANMASHFGCRRSDMDADDDVDGFDFLTFANCYNGANRPPLCP